MVTPAIRCWDPESQLRSIGMMKAIGPPPRPPDYVPDLAGRPIAPSHGNGSRLWLARHAEVASQWHSIAYGSMDVPLSESGERATEALGRAFARHQVDAVISSDLARARLLGEQIAASTSAPLSSSPELREMNRGKWQGIPKSEFIENWQAASEHYWRDPFRWHTPGGEGDELLYARSWPVIELALEGIAGGSLVVAAHGQLNRVLISRLLGIDTPESYEYYLDPAHASCLVDAPGGWRIESHNIGAEALG
jgi:alpha-ribazole phosphatase